MKKRIRIICHILVIAILLCGCSTKLAEGYDKAVIIETAEDVINEVHVKGAKVVLEERMREDFIGNIELDEMNDDVINLVSGLGNFLTYTQKTVIGKQYKETAEDFAVVLITATYEKGEANFTITFDKDMNMVGFYAK